MNWLQRLWDRFRGKAAKPTPSRASSDQRLLRHLLSSMGPGWWASDHAEEAQHFTGWNYIAIHSKAKMALAASVRIYKDIPTQNEQIIQKSVANPDVPDESTNLLPDSHPLVRLLQRPNPRLFGGLFRYQILQQISLTGSAHIWVVKNSLGLPVELWVLPTGLIRPMPASPEFPDGAYWVSTNGSFQQSYATLGIGAYSGFTLDAREVIKIGWPHPLWLGDGMSPLAACSLLIDITEEMDRATWNAFQNGVMPSMVLSYEGGQVSDETLDRAEQKLNELKSGTKNAGKTIFLSNVKPHQISRSPAELDFVNGRSQGRDISMAVHQMAPISAGVTEAGSYSAFVAGVKQTTELSVQPDLDLIAQSFTHELAPYFGSGITIEITAKGIDDPQTLNANLSVDLQARAITINEYRAKRGLPPIEWGHYQVSTDVMLAEQNQKQSLEISSTNANNQAFNDSAYQDAGGSGGDDQYTGEVEPDLLSALDGIELAKSITIADWQFHPNIGWLEKGFTGIRQDSIGRINYFVDGRRVAKSKFRQLKNQTINWKYLVVLIKDAIVNPNPGKIKAISATLQQLSDEDLSKIQTIFQIKEVTKPAILQALESKMQGAA